MKLSNKFKDLQEQFFTAMGNPDMTDEEREASFGEMMDGMMTELRATARDEADRLVSAQNKVPNFTNRELQFFNDIKTDVGTKNEILLPQETIERVFDDMIQQHPFLKAIGLKNAMLRIKVITSDPENTAVWGKVFSEIKGQLETAFKEKDITQAKLTAFAVVPNDALEYGPAWLYTYIMTQFNESFAIFLEDGFINGKGATTPDSPQPIGLAQKLATPATQKDVTGTLTLADAKASITELAEVMGKLQIKPNGAERTTNEMANVKMLVNNTDFWRLRGLFTIQNDAGVYVENVPFGIELLPSAKAPKGKALFFLPNCYDAYIGGGLTMKEYTETLGLEDATLYTGKLFAYGEARDEGAALLYDLPAEKVAAKSKTK